MSGKKADPCRVHVHNGTNQGQAPWISAAVLETHDENNQALGPPLDVKWPSISASMRHSYTAVARISVKFLALSLQHVTCLPASTQSYPLKISSGQVHYSPRHPLVASQLTQRKSHSPTNGSQFSASRHTVLFDIPGTGRAFAADVSCLSEWSASRGHQSSLPHFL